VPRKRVRTTTCRNRIDTTKLTTVIPPRIMIYSSHTTSSLDAFPLQDVIRRRCSIVNRIIGA
jgi:hypothetical protein